MRLVIVVVFFIVLMSMSPLLVRTDLELLIDLAIRLVEGVLVVFKVIPRLIGLTGHLLSVFSGDDALPRAI